MKDEEFLGRVYRELLGRDPDPLGLEFFADRLRNGTSRAEIVIQLAKSDEYVSLLLRRHTHIRDLRDDDPSRFVEVHPIDCDVPAKCLHMATADDFDWLEERIIANGYYERPGSWSFEISPEKEVVAEIVAAFAPERALELGCANGVVLELLRRSGIFAEGIDISRMAIARAFDGIRDRIHFGDLLDIDLPPGSFDLVFGLDIFEHLNPNRLDQYFERVEELLTPDGVLLANVPAYGPDDVFGTVLPFLYDDWVEAARQRRPFRILDIDEDGYPVHGHLVWADTEWWEAQFTARSLRRARDVEHAIHARYDRFFDVAAPFRRSLYVFVREPRPAARLDHAIAQLRTPSPVLRALPVT